MLPTKSIKKATMEMAQTIKKNTLKYQPFYSKPNSKVKNDIVTHFHIKQWFCYPLGKNSTICLLLFKQLSFRVLNYFLSLYVVCLNRFLTRSILGWGMAGKLNVTVFPMLLNLFNKLLMLGVTNTYLPYRQYPGVHEFNTGKVKP